MNKEWSEQNKKIQKLLKKQTLEEGIKELLSLREKLFNEMLAWKTYLLREDYNKIPYMNAEGYHNKTVAYSIWHIVRIEDIVVNSLIRKNTEILFENEFISRISSPIITTGNELIKNQIVDFSEKLCIDALYEYAKKVYTSTNDWLKRLKKEDLSKCFNEDDKKYQKSLKVVSEDENAIWLVDYWCGKDTLGLIKMPISRHWIMHIEAGNRIIEKIKRSTDGKKILDFYRE